ncbi:putative glucan endo-1,3-beta-glucosidase btgC [Neonectria ditissima]|uniref:glucan endo-1,3-beta-D-glucosidase n=1 Tax=Neonectria ditissima TaxID=78410 RepID=A0A0N8H4W3_9HYPO|nr:putative glucan endo-1,3-beta-glucosidase btgC [Neonectria ditissima]
MPQYHGDPYEREPLDSYQNHYESSPSRHPAHPAHPAQSYSPSQTPYYDAPPPASRSFHPSTHPDSAYNHSRMPPQDNYSHHSNSQHSGSAGYDSPRRASPNPPPPPHADNSYYSRAGGRGVGGGSGGNQGYTQPPSYGITPGADNFSQTASGGMAGIAYNVADRNPRDSGMEAMRSTGQVPPPPSRSQYHDPPPPLGTYSPQSSYDAAYGQNSTAGDSHSSLAGLGAAAVPLGARSPHRGEVDPYADDPYQGYGSRNPLGAHHLGIVNPNDIEDDGDDGISYHRSQRNSMLSLPHSDRGKRAAAAAAGVGGGAAAGGLLAAGHQRGGDYDAAALHEKPSDWMDKKAKKSKRCKWAIIIIVCVVIVGAIVGGVLGSTLSNKKGSGGSSTSGDSAKEDEAKNGDLDANSQEIKDLLNNSDLHRVFPGMDYTPINTQYPACLHNPPSQNNVTRDVAVLSQLTNKIRLYGTDCNQTQMLIHAIDQLKLKDVKVWLGVWQDGNETTNARQLEQMWDILDEYGEDPFEGVIVANEILFREEMTITELGTVLDGVRTNFTKKNINLPVATSDLGDDWTSALAKDSDYIMANIHPFFAGVTAEKAASWTYSFWENQNKQFWKSDTEKNIISETGWPTSGGKNCGSATSCTDGSVAGIDELNTFMEGWVCDALKNGTNYFWFEAFDEPWKEKFNEKGKAWEDQWGLLTVDRELKKGVKIPDCDGKTVG